MSPPANIPSRPQSSRRWLGPWLLWGLAAVVLALVFAWYLSPHFVVDMAARLWSCL